MKRSIVCSKLRPGVIGLALLSSLTVTCQDWTITLDNVGTFSSPRVADLNGDGVRDVILGTGREEFHACDSAIVAVDGKTGGLLWRVSSIDQIFGSAGLMDINNDGIQDAVIGGRSAELFALDGRTGAILWKFDKTTKVKGDKWYNFYNPQFIPDQDHDGVRDILISNGGNVLAEPFDTNRPAGYLLVLSGKDDHLLAKARVPDKHEIYMSLTLAPTPDGKDYTVVFGTGGDTVGGHLYVTTLSQIMKGNISRARLLDTSPNKGYIAPACWADITRDQIPDLIVNAVEGKMLAFDGRSFEKLWEVKVPNTEVYSSITPGYFAGDDDIPDFFVSYAMGRWPDLEWSRQLMLNGTDGTIEYVDSLGFYQTSTPVALDYDRDGVDEALLSVNIHVYDESNKRSLYNILAIVNFKTGEVSQIGEALKGANISTTPWIGDLDDDGMLDIIYCNGTNTLKSYSFTGFQIHRVVTTIPIDAHTVRWGAYMGSRYDGVFRE